MRDLSARLDDLVSATSISFGGASFQHDETEHAPAAAAAAAAVGVQCDAASDGVDFGYEGSTGGGTCGVVTIAPAPAVERPTRPCTIECAAPHEIMAQLDADFQVARGGSLILGGADLSAAD
ncbi:hypothetical protein CYMTET_24076 [Cymbomonas tetramitiformis]|uniref:Uncharacterized protein n=1 Tax=Cymbomonas tetramitiformis TaxID=36881 RepID=A0AAE0FWK8_9CHLO|nr:hypothetical protein CYMTET_24076 [Cymbomonas tetramitiformis]